MTCLAIVQDVVLCMLRLVLLLVLSLQTGVHQAVGCMVASV